MSCLDVHVNIVSESLVGKYLHVQYCPIDPIFSIEMPFKSFIIQTDEVR